MKRSTLLHLRIPFSLFLMPFFAFAISQTTDIKIYNLFVSFLAVHLFLYPASNGYNSYFDKDEGSIGGLEKPPATEKELYYVSLLFDLIAVALGMTISTAFCLMLLIYGIASKAYSHPIVRFKKYPFAGLFIVVVFQGFFTYLMSVAGITGHGIERLSSPDVIVPGILCSLLLLGSYPMTQIYQHDEDRKRGDLTLSIFLGIKGTFIWSSTFFMIASALFVKYLAEKHSILMAAMFPLFLSPVLFYFISWFYNIVWHSNTADWKSTMKLNKISAYCTIAYFIFLGVAGRLN